MQRHRGDLASGETCLFRDHSEDRSWRIRCGLLTPHRVHALTNSELTTRERGRCCGVLWNPSGSPERLYEDMVEHQGMLSRFASHTEQCRERIDRDDGSRCSAKQSQIQHQKPQIQAGIPNIESKCRTGRLADTSKIKSIHERTLGQLN